MERELTGDEHLRALAALEAVVAGDDAALVFLAGGAGERPLAERLAVYGQHTLHRILVTAFGIDAVMDYDESSRLVSQVNSDPMARIVFTLTDALHNQAALAGDDPTAPKLIACRPHAAGVDSPLRPSSPRVPHRPPNSRHHGDTGGCRWRVQ